MTPAEIFTAARDMSDIEVVAGIKMVKGRSACPICRAGEKSKSQPFKIDAKKQTFYCFSCQEGGDAIALEHILRSRSDESRLDAAKRLLGYQPASDAPARSERKRPSVDVPDERDQWKLDFANRLWAAALPAEGTLVQRYLVARGFRGWVLKSILRQVRYHPAAFHSHPWDPIVFPAMVARPRTPAGATGGVHVTYLNLNGREKAPVDLQKIMWGPQGRDGLPGGVWLTHPSSPGPLIVGEGIESTGSAGIWLDKPCRLVAALSLGRLQGGWADGPNGFKDPDLPVADLTRPPFLWPFDALNTDADHRRVMIALDRDMKPQRMKVHSPFRRGRHVWREIDGEQRAMICGSLARQHWTASGASPVEIYAPDRGRDWNTQLNSVTA